MTEVSRRTVIKATGAIGTAMLPAGAAIGTTNAKEPEVARPIATRSICAAAAASTTYVFFNSEEAAFIEAVVARLIPADEEWSGAFEACVPNYIDKQLAGAWGSGERLYRSGPWQPGTPSQGYQLPYTPAELFRTALGAINKELSHTPFAKMSPDAQDSYRKNLEAGGKDLGGVPSDVFFAHLWESTLEGFFSDPV
jgi:gluconate 2-dehydrogenase gamma chain